MKRAVFFILFLLALSSCHYTLPLVKQLQSTYIMNDTVEGKAVTDYVSKYNYFRISRYGITGVCSKHLYYDGSGRVVAMRISRRSAMVYDGFAIHHWRMDVYSPDRKLLSRKKGVIREQGWSSPITHERTVDYSSGSRVVTKGN